MHPWVVSEMLEMHDADRLLRERGYIGEWLRDDAPLGRLEETINCVRNETRPTLFFMSSAIATRCASSLEDTSYPRSLIAICGGLHVSQWWCRLAVAG